ncbi:LysM peptidoglycan-binding domain-containing protein [Bacillus sp. FJAT-29790]|uniref:CAP domain-containing protein n=1 Tax=Bacillus sp. FJAT-29790 TaxID=1895002 RepID=UPI001C21466F|nr:CAP domain-containing protein [Bacillus sp. FJAT-29790]MBU8877688.1 LysM peptidoglycan-binding domain-containing protein [Bacillus sp. FJAT-29790]
MKKIIANIICLWLFFSAGKDVFAGTKYIVVRGDTLWKIARSNHSDLKHLIKSNPQIQNANLIYPGQGIMIPINADIFSSEKLLNKGERELLQITNAKRAESGLRPFALDPLLSQAARKKSIDMKEKQYVSHYSPTYGNPAMMLKELQIQFRNIKENIGAGHRSAYEIFITWLNTSVNRENILDEKGTRIGIGYAEGGLHGHYWTILIAD